MPKRPFKVPPPRPGKDKIIIKISEPKKPRIPKEVREALFRRKAGPMGGGKEKEELPLKEIEGEEKELSLKEKQERLLELLFEFNQWTQNEYTSVFENLGLHRKSEKLKELIRKELQDLGNKESYKMLELWLEELKYLNL